jgi:hypothetical protein
MLTCVDSLTPALHLSPTSLAPWGARGREKRLRKEANARAQAWAIKYVLPGLVAALVSLVVFLLFLQARSKAALEL